MRARMGRLSPGLGLLVLGMGLTPACGPAKSVPEAGAVVVRVMLTTGAPRPDELRAWVYDDDGRLWDGARFPSEGALPAVGGPDLGTILIQPGASHGALRLHLRGLAGGGRVVDGVASIPTENRDRAPVEVQLGPALPADRDGDDVPDGIDDCPDLPDPAQAGCAAAPDGASGDDTRADAAVADSNSDADRETGAEAGADTASDVTGDATDGPVATTDAQLDVGPATDARTNDTGGTGACDGGACDKAQGSACGSNAECVSGACVDGVCCTNACAGPCRSCNQPNATGVCQAFPQGTDPERDCASGATCNGAGSCGAAPPPDKANGQLCAAGAECKSGFCTDGVCCDTACDSPCQNCGSGTCQAVKKTQDVPECAGAKTCNARGMCG